MKKQEQNRIVSEGEGRYKSRSFLIGEFIMTNKIKQLREQKNITRKQLSELSGVHYKKITDYENNYIKTNNITVGNLCRIADALGCMLDELVER